MKTYVIASFYKFVPLHDFEDMKAPLLKVMQQHNLLGTLILAHEGINGSFAGKPEDVFFLYEYLRIDPRFSDLSFKETFDDFMPFEKAKVKFRKEIVSLGVPGIDPLKATGERVPAEKWNAVISSPDVLVIDTRNDYEFELGTFKNAINPHTENFRDFPEYVNNHLLDKKHQKIAMFCTGGIRCEKSTAYLISLGFEDVVQLDGGILTYLETIPKEDSLWGGGCFVFDERLTIDG
ncbi:MAG: rhodanese-related sulfurtransferase [Legionellales bacterium]|nr:rhodanese-related sulfurtransferase [Legionellales bacterium]